MLQNEQLKTSSERLEDLSRRIEQSESFDMEAAKFDISEHIYSVMERQDVTKAKLAGRLGKSRAYVTKVLQGNANFTLESLVKISRALDCKLDVSHVLVPAHQGAQGFDWGQIKNQKLKYRACGFERVAREHLQLVELPERDPASSRGAQKKEEINASLALAS